MGLRVAGFKGLGSIIFLFRALLGLGFLGASRDVGGIYWRLCREIKKTRATAQLCALTISSDVQVVFGRARIGHQVQHQTYSPKPVTVHAKKAGHVKSLECQ